MKTYRNAISLTVLLVSTCVTVQAATNDSGTRGIQDSRLKIALRLNPNLVTSKISRLNSRMPKLSRRVRARLANLVSRGCGCALTQDDQDALGSSCWKTCVTGWGVSYSTLVACGGVCAGAATGNPVAIAVCAGCLGTGEWILAGCALYCAWGGGGGGHGILLQDPQARLVKRSLHSSRT